MQTGTCSECDRPITARGLCSKHYMRQRRRQLSDHPVIGRRGVGSNDAEITLNADDARAKLAAKVTELPSGCIEFTGTKNQGGYGMLHLAGRDHLAHRVAYVLANAPAAGRVIMHSCDNPACVNPAHLSAGSHSDNMQDMLSKGRSNYGNCGQHLRDRSKHPRNRAVGTVAGERFESAALAAEKYGCSAGYMQRLCRLEMHGFFYVDE